jgi:hypothetical protein
MNFVQANVRQQLSSTQRRSGIDPRPVHLGCMVNEVTVR